MQAIAPVKNEPHVNHCATASEARAAMNAVLARRKAFFGVPKPAVKAPRAPEVVPAAPAIKFSISGAGTAKFQREPALLYSLHQVNFESPIFTIKDIQLAVCHVTKIPLKDMISARRQNHLIRPRHIAIALSKRLTRNSFPEIGRRFGGRDHATIWYVVKKTELVIADIEPLIEAKAPLIQIVLAALRSFKRLDPPSPKRGRVGPKLIQSL